MSFPIITDPWNYNDQEGEVLLRKMWWERIPQAVSFTLVGQEGEEQAEFVETIAGGLLKSSPNSVSVRGKDRTVEYNLRNLHNDRWYAVAFVDRVNEAGVLDTWSVGIAFSPVQNSLEDHLKIWIALWLWE